jgi:hypothetical protein
MESLHTGLLREKPPPTSFYGITKFSNSKIYPESCSDMGCCCGLCVTRSHSTVAGNEADNTEGMSLIHESNARNYATKGGDSIILDETVAPMNNATAEGHRLSELRRQRILQTKPLDGAVPTSTSNMFRSDQSSL